MVLDSNVLISDFRLQGRSINDLWDASQTLGYTVYIPQVVIDEVVGKYEEFLQENVAQLRKSLAAIRRLTGNDLLDAPSIAQVLPSPSEYRHWLLDEIHSRLWKVVPYPNVSHEELVSRIINKRKPFYRGERGYRDALVWATVVELAQQSKSTILLVTANVSDFGESSSNGETTLHNQLCEDLAMLGIEASQVKLFTGLGVLVEACVTPELSQLEAVQTKLSSGEYPDLDLEREISSCIYNVLEGTKLLGDKLGLMGDWDDEVVITGIYSDPYDYCVQEVKRLATGEFLVFITVSIECEIEHYMDEADLRHVPEDEWPGRIRRSSFFPSVYVSYLSKELWVGLEVTLDKGCQCLQALELEFISYNGKQILCGKAANIHFL
ncbi:MAG: PIN domain-containing protein [Armatimonadota bacterium]